MTKAERLDRLLWDHVTQARWFSGKGRVAQLGGVTVLADVAGSVRPGPDAGQAPQPGAPAARCVVRLMVVEVAYGDHQPDQDADIEYYQVPVSLYPEDAFEQRLALSTDRPSAEPADHDQSEHDQQSGDPGDRAQHSGSAATPPTLMGALGRVSGDQVGMPDEPWVMVCDATADAVACRLIMSRLLDAPTPPVLPPGHRPSEPLVVRLHDRTGLSADVPARRFAGEQSNTSIVYGTAALLKVFRRLELGRNLDIQVHHVLQEAGVRDAAHLFGWVEGRWSASGGARVHADLAMLVELLHDARDGFELARSACAEHEDFAERAHDLGRALRHVHAALAEHFEEGTVEGAGRAHGMRRRLERAVGIVPALEPYAPALRDLFTALETLSVPVQRIHGDFHLGQALLTPEGWKIIDFEGEPLKTLAERAEPDTPLRDVAGLLRSVGYAASADAGPDGLRWAAGARAAFLDGWSGRPLTDDEQTLLNAYEADKAVYEAVYETRNRPDWVTIPLTAIATLTGIDAGSPHRHSTERRRDR